MWVWFDTFSMSPVWKKSFIRSIPVFQIVFNCRRRSGYDFEIKIFGFDMCKKWGRIIMEKYVFLGFNY